MPVWADKRCSKEAIDKFDTVVSSSSNTSTRSRYSAQSVNLARC
jgi:hypothetical protein